MSNLNQIEYIGLNIFEGKILNKKTYFYSNELPDIIPPNIRNLLKPFDYAEREKGFDYSVSSFIPNCTISKIDIILNFISGCGVKIEKDYFIHSFCYIADFEKLIHYDPIVSFKFKDNKITGISFYVTALRNKSLGMQYFNIVRDKLNLECFSTISQLISKCIDGNIVDMFLVSWDFDENYLRQNKIYLKIRDVDAFIDKIKYIFPYIVEFSYMKEFKLRDFAFVFASNELKMLNLYFKPI